ncbi:cytochrome c oxidase assembly factor 4 homolog, mitochondrial [Chelonus insularis]|uniref:cytochrome c oxidase assembly factor 4 homolog, mitochondrial n=1 Tax=Chelonus insularis TaxID=460826 RepID=UPI001589B138|nr:cytochrome c oxidase assembly factor 4 homolog, mitochondrial [Chelonus insularis]
MTLLTESKSQKEEIDDPLERMLKQTGCIELHYQVAECIAETQDWRKCQDQVQKFKVCMEKYRKSREELYK